MHNANPLKPHLGQSPALVDSAAAVCLAVMLHCWARQRPVDAEGVNKAHGWLIDAS